MSMCVYIYTFAHLHIFIYLPLGLFRSSWSLMQNRPLTMETGPTALLWGLASSPATSSFRPLLAQEASTYELYWDAGSGGVPDQLAYSGTLPTAELPSCRFRAGSFRERSGEQGPLLRASRRLVFDCGIQGWVDHTKKASRLV